MESTQAHRKLPAWERAFLGANRALVVAMMAVMATLVFANVIARYVFNFSIIWVEELTQFMMIWITYVGAGLAMREGRHVAVEMFQDLLPAPAAKALRVLVALAMLVFLGFLLVLGIQFAQFAWEQETPVMNIRVGIAYLAIPVGAAIFAVHLVCTFRDFVAKRFEHDAEAELAEHA